MSPAYLPDDERWAPATYEEAGNVVMPVTFPNGTTAEVVFDARAALHEMSASPRTYVDGPGDCGWELNATRYDPHLGWVSGAAPLRTYVRDDGETFELWNGTRDHEPYDALIHRAGSWSVILLCLHGEDMSDNTFETWARGLRAHETSDGLIVVDVVDPIEAPTGDGTSSPTIQFGDRNVVVELSSTGGCDHLHADQETNDGVIQWCVDPDDGIYVYATSFGPSGKEVLDALVETFEVRSIVRG